MKLKNLFLSLALLGLMTGCTEYVDSQYDQMNENYTRGFIKVFGIIDPEHTWGFGPNDHKVSSRADEDEDPTAGELPVWEQKIQNIDIEVNGNQWKNPPLVKDWERKKVVAFLHRQDAADYSVTLNLNKPYFLTHVGSCYHVTAEGATLPGGHTVSRDVYTSLDGKKSITSHDHMDNLHVAINQVTSLDGIGDNKHAEYSSWLHVNNFNATDNTNHNGNTIVVAKGKGGSYDFAYQNTALEGSKYMDNYIIIPGSLIDYRLSSYYYLCFDFTGYDPNETYRTTYRVNVTLQKGDKQATYSDVLVFDQIYDCAVLGIGQPTTDDIVSALNKLKDDEYFNQTLRELLEDTGVTVIVNSMTLEQQINGDKITFPDGYYDDWIVRVCGDAVHELDPRMPSYPHDDPDAYRVFVEDLSVVAGLDIENHASDWDFNDVVFDFKLNSDKSLTLVLRQLGGTLPVYFCDSNVWETGNHSRELHSYLGYSSNQMVNTDTGNTADPYTFTEEDLAGLNFNFDYNNHKDATNVNKVHVFVQKDGKMYPLEANKGKAPSKLCVPLYLAAPTESMKITIPYPRFEQYVQNHEINFWEAPVDANGN